LFTEAGGKFNTPVLEIKKKLLNCKAIVFDWDGVFNDGSKKDSSGSSFSEPDSMGINLLRFSFWLRDGKMPPVAILSGEENQSGLVLAQREHYPAIYFKASNKIDSLRHFARIHEINPPDILFVFDDVLDLSVAEVSGVRIQVSRKGGVLFNHYVASHGLADYVTGSAGGYGAIREGSEAMMGIMGMFDEALRERIAYRTKYKTYLAERQVIHTHVFQSMNGHISIFNP
jgi:3-deoxy-D-manno-octulosonate 8-phosphate phosphatase (KDO 8-P phosphatase)